MLTAHKCINCTEGNPSEKQSTSRLLIALLSRALLLPFHFLNHLCKFERPEIGLILISHIQE